MADLQIVVFNLNVEVCGVDTSQIKQIIKYQEITKVPKMPKFIEGMINLRGRVIPVINLNKRFEFGETELTKKTKIIITEIEGHPLGFLVNDVQELMKLSDENIEVLPDLIHEAGNDYMKKVGKRGESLITIVDLHAILTESEMKRLKT